MNITEIADSYANLSHQEIEDALEFARKTQREAVETDNEFVYLQQDRVIQALLLVKHRRERAR